MPGPYPKIEPYEHGRLDVGDGNLLYREACGNPEGKPAVVLHGGPGSGRTTGMRRMFDPAAYRVVLFDQRNKGCSTPHASEPETSLAANTTSHLIADIEALREHLGIDRWLVWSKGPATKRRTPGMLESTIAATDKFAARRERHVPGIVTPAGGPPAGGAPTTCNTRGTSPSPACTPAR